jgi:RNA polymerase sigma-70 factor (ECF subfamily)
MGVNPLHPPDEVLVEKSKKGDLDAFEELVRRYEGKVYNMAYRFMGNHADAGDLAQEGFIRLYQALPGFRGESSFSTWMYRIVSNACRDELRRRQRQRNVSLDELAKSAAGNIPVYSAEESPEDAAERHELQQYVQQCLTSLSEEHRLVLIMREMQGLSYEEIAAALGCSLGTVKSRLNRARHALKDKIKARRELFNGEYRLSVKGGTSNAV